MPIYWGDYIRDTCHLTIDQHGAYLLLIAHYWVTGKPLPDDDRKLAQVTRIGTKKWRGMRPTIADFFTISGGVWVHKRVQGEIENAIKNQELRSKKAQDAANKRWGNKDAKAMPGACTSPSPSPSPPSASKDTDGQEAVRLWNLVAEKFGLSKVQSFTESRKKKIKLRLKEIGGLDGWKMALIKVAESKFLTGGNDSGWTASFDFLLQPSSMARLMEGNYDNRKSTDPDSAEAHTQQGLDAAERLRKIIKDEKDGEK